MATNTSRGVSAQKDRSSMKSYRDMGYREKPATPNSPSGTTVTTMYDHLLSPPSPAEEEEKDERLRNDLLDEICNDMGIDDSMDLDFDDDFCYNGQQKPGQRHGPSSSSTKGNDSDVRRASVTTSSSGYATSDSLCAIAKLTRSITSENSTTSDNDSKQRVEGADCSAIVKQEPTTNHADTEMRLGNVNDTDQGKAAAAAAAAANKLALQKQMSDSGAGDLKRKKETESLSHQEMAAEQQTCCMSEMGSSASTQQSHPSHSRGQPQHVPQQQPPQQQPAQQQQYVDYSYQDDYAMEDMTAPDTMINFSEMPQQPNYYQCPQSAQDSLNLGFNMSLQHQPGHPGFSQAPTSTAQQFHMSTAGRGGLWGVPQHGLYNGTDLSRPSHSQQQLLHLHNSFQGSAGPAHQEQRSNAFQPYHVPQAASSSSANSHQSQPNFHRSESFPGAHGPSSSFGSMPGLPQQSASPPETSAQKSTTAAQPVSAANLTSFSTASTNNKQIFMRQLVADNKSNAFRSHPLFPLLRDLIIADMNYDKPEFPHNLIQNLPPDFNKLLRNYQSRNPDMEKQYHIPSVNSVVMDALKYAHHSLMDKIRQNKTVDLPQRQQSAPPLGQESAAPVTAMPPSSILASPMSRKPLPGSEYLDDPSKHDMSKGPVGYGMIPSPMTPDSFRARRESGSVYGSDMGPPTPGSTYSQPLSVDTGCASPNSNRHPMNLSTTSQPPTPLYNPAQNAPPQYHHPSSGFVRPGQQPNPRNPYMTPHGGPPCPPPNYTVSPNNPPLSRHQQTMYELGPPPPGPGMYADLSSPFHDPYNNCMPPPPAAHLPRLHHMGAPDRHLMYMNNINDGSLVKTMMESGKDMYETMSDAGSVMSGHSMQGSVKGQQQGQGKTTEGRKHASLPKEAVNIMLNWLREHQEKPYPNDDEKGMLIKQTGLTITQINYWFTNARRRLLPKWKGEDM